MTRVGIVAALPAEAATFCGHRCRVGETQEHRSALMICSGMGADRARSSAEDLVERGVVGLISWGTAGGLSPTLRPGDLLLPDQVRNEDGEALPCDPVWRGHIESQLSPGLSVHVGLQVSSRVVVSTQSEKRRLFQTGAHGVDMESSAIGEVACRAGLPYIVIRAVCDPSDCAVPRTALQALSPDGRFQPWKIACSLLTRPTDLGGLIRLGNGLRAAQRSLTKALSILGGRDGLAAGVPSSRQSAP